MERHHVIVAIDRESFLVECKSPVEYANMFLRLFPDASIEPTYDLGIIQSQVVWKASELIVYLIWRELKLKDIETDALQMKI